MRSFKIKITPQVEEFIRMLPPDPKHTLRQSLKLLGSQQGDIKPLEDPLEGYYRLRVGKYRVVFYYENARTIICEFAETRKLVYELFEQDSLRALLKKTRSE